jgi:hypothetical protein
MRSHKVVESHEERRKNHGAIKGFKPGARPSVEFIGSIESLDELLERSEFGTFRIVVLKSDNRAFLDRVVRGVKWVLRVLTGRGVISDDSAAISGIAIRHKTKRLYGAGFRIAKASREQSQGGKSSSRVGKVISADRSSAFIKNEPRVSVFTFDGDIGFIGGGDTDRLGTVAVNEWRKVSGRGSDVVGDRLMRNFEIKDSFKRIASEPQTEPKVNDESQTESNDVESIVNLIEIHWRVFGAGKRKVFGPVMIFAKEVMQFELTGFSLLSYPFFFGRESGEILEKKRALFVWAFIGAADAIFFPVEKSIAAMRTPIGGFTVPSALVGGRRLVAEFA